MFSRAVLIARKLFYARLNSAPQVLEHTSTAWLPGFYFRFLPSIVVCLKTVRNIYSLFLYTVIDLFSDIKAIDSVGDPPLPIPNREVKPVSADGTANIRGRVGHRHFYNEDFKKLRSSFFLLLIPLVCLGRWWLTCKSWGAMQKV